MTINYTCDVCRSAHDSESAAETCEEECRYIAALREAIMGLDADCSRTMEAVRGSLFALNHHELIVVVNTLTKVKGVKDDA